MRRFAGLSAQPPSEVERTMVTSHQFITDRHQRAEQAGLDFEAVITSFVLRP